MTTTSLCKDAATDFVDIFMVVAVVVVVVVDTVAAVDNVVVALFNQNAPFCLQSFFQFHLARPETSEVITRATVINLVRAKLFTWSQLS